jgi:hypothetical protein
MTAATYTNTKTARPIAKRAAAQEQPLFNGTPAYARLHERKSSRVPLIAGGIAVIATIALVAGTTHTARDAEPFTAAQTAPASSPAAIATATPVQSAPTATPGAQLIAPAPAPVVRQQARVTLRPTRMAPAPLDANSAGQDASTTVPAAPAAPAPITIPPVQATPEAEAVPAPAPIAPEAAAPQTAPMSNSTSPYGEQNLLTRGLVTGV